MKLFYLIRTNAKEIVGVKINYLSDLDITKEYVEKVNTKLLNHKIQWEYNEDIVNEYVWNSSALHTIHKLTKRYKCFEPLLHNIRISKRWKIGKRGIEKINYKNLIWDKREKSFNIRLEKISDTINPKLLFSITKDKKQISFKFFEEYEDYYCYIPFTESKFFCTFKIWKKPFNVY